MTIEELLREYRIEGDDLRRIREVGAFLEGRLDELADFHYSLLLDKPELKAFFPNEATMKRARTAFLDWSEDLLRGEYNNAYFLKINRIGATHVRIGLPAHHVNVQMSHVRSYLADVAARRWEGNTHEAAMAVASLNKALDLNLDLMTRSYREEELRVNFLSHRIDTWIMRTARWFVDGFNMALVFGLVVIGVMALGLSADEVIHLADHRDLERGAIGALSTILILWVVIELLDTQIRHMKGRAFAIKVFVSVALVAELRRVLIASIEHTDRWETAILAGTILTLGVVYYLISKIDRP
ncbi:MAG: phosphate-starvation-inducible PsiE family protein [Nitrospinae bacterium]|nr:phosphate-starvation-inducible PsiE family protein [Nitrospinota bacterium]